MGDVLYRGLTDRLFGVPGQWNIRRCASPQCGTLWLDPRPVKEDLHRAYVTYYTHEDDADNVSKPRGRQIIELIEQVWLGILKLRSERRAIEHMFLEKVKPGRVLEVGCGDGQMLERLRSLGWEVEGQDVDPNAAGLRQTGSVGHLGELAEIGLPCASYEAVVMNHVIEHADDPCALLRECFRLLKPGGVLVATTPNPESYGHAEFGFCWRGLDVPRHLNLFPPQALAAVAEAAGFAERSVWTTAARAGGMLAASRDIRKCGSHHMRGPTTFSHLISAFWLQLTARLAHVRSRRSGEEAVLMARK